MKNNNVFSRSVLAGLMIALASAVNISCNNRYAGAVMFSVGLITICCLNLNLFTGKIGYSWKSGGQRARYYITVWLGNLVGSVFCGVSVRAIKPELVSKAAQMCQDKLDMNFAQLFISGCLCGVLVHTAVHIYNNVSDPVGKHLGILSCVPAFVLAGLGHCIADMFYFSLCVSSLKGLLMALIAVLLVTAGNAVGAVIFDIILEK